MDFYPALTIAAVIAWALFLRLKELFDYAFSSTNV